MPAVGDEPDRRSEAVDPRDDPEDAARLVAYAAALADGIERALPGWVERCVGRLMMAYEGRVPDDVSVAARVAGAAARDEIGPEVRALLLQDIDAQRTNPLTLVRGAVRYPSDVLRRAGVPPVVRDDLAVQHFPDDDYDLVPTAFADLDPALRDVGLEWGAAKAHVHLHRRRMDGQR